MTLDREFQRHRREHPRDLIIGLVASILLHSILLIEAKNWLQAFAPERKRELKEPIPIEFVEVPPKEAKPPPNTKRRAANNSVAGGQADPKRPVSAARLRSPVKPKGASSPNNPTAPKPNKLVAKPTRSTAILPNRSRQQPQPKPQETAAVPTISKPQPKPQETAAVPTISKPQPKPQETAAVPTTPKPRTLTRQQKNNQLHRERLESKANRRTQSYARGSRISGAASRLGGPVTLSSRDLGGNSQAALPNSNRFNQGAAGIDARRDADIGSYLQQLQQQVRRQWIPGATQNSRQTVIHFVVSRSGQVSNLRIVRPSGFSAVDQAALSAIQRAAPFGRLPVGYSDNYIKIRFTFNINVSGGLDLWAR